MSVLHSRTDLTGNDGKLIMATQIIPQPDGKYALFSTVSDGFIIYDATREQVVSYFGDKARKVAEERTRDIFRVLDEGGEPYYQFGRKFEEAARLHLQHGNDPHIRKLLNQCK